MIQTKKQSQSFWNFGPQEIVAALCTGFCVTPTNTIVDKSIIQNANGKMPLWTGVANGFKNMFLKPRIFFTAFEFKWILFVYNSTYITSNLADHYTIPGLDPSISKLISVFVANSATGIIKDKALTQRLGLGKPHPFPLKSLGLFFLRDLIAMASAFTLPPLLGKVIQRQFGYSETTSHRIAQISLPALIQIIATPLHLLGLNIYNKPDYTTKERLSHLRKIYIESVSLRVLRFLPAFGIGGVINIEVRKLLLKKQNSNTMQQDYQI